MAAAVNAVRDGERRRLRRRAAVRGQTAAVRPSCSTVRFTAGRLAAIPLATRLSPRMMLLINLIGSLMAKYKPSTVVLNGDVKHGFSGINDKEWRHILELFDLITMHAKLIIIKGNHDTILKPIADKRRISPSPLAEHVNETCLKMTEPS